MGLKDLYISFFNDQDKQKIDLITGSQASVKEFTKGKAYYITQNNLSIAQFSKKMQGTIREHETKGYKIVDITIENVVELFDENSNIYRQLPLCKVVMET
jgi:hypothetical protein